MPPEQGKFKRRQWNIKSGLGFATSSAAPISRIRPKKGAGPGGWNRKRAKKRKQGKGQSRRGF